MSRFYTSHFHAVKQGRKVNLFPLFINFGMEFAICGTYETTFELRPDQGRSLITVGISAIYIHFIIHYSHMDYVF